MSYNSEVLADSPVRYWRLGETVGTSGAGSVNEEIAGDDGTPSGVTFGTASLITADADTAATFGGSNNRIDAGATLNLSGANATFEFLCDLDVSQQNYAGLLCKGAGSNDWAFQREAGSSDLYVYGNAFNAAVYTGKWATICDGNPHHIVVTYTHATLTWELWIDGTSQGALTGDPIGHNGANPIRIGASRDPLGIAGVMDEVAIYNTKLSNARIAAHFAAMTAPEGPAAPTNLVLGAVTSSTIEGTVDDAASIASAADGLLWQYDVVNTFTSPVSVDTPYPITQPIEFGLLLAETEYFFRVRAYNGDGNSDWSNTDSATTAAAEADVTPPTASSWTVPSAGTTVTATLSESGCTPAIGTGGFTLALGTTATVASWAISGTTLTLTLSGTIYAGQTVEVSYDNAGASEAIADASDNLLADITDADVTNNSTVEAPPPPDLTSSDKHRRRVSAKGLARALRAMRRQSRRR
jgi:hypothetical protein